MSPSAVSSVSRTCIFIPETMFAAMADREYATPAFHEVRLWTPCCYIVLAISFVHWDQPHAHNTTDAVHPGQSSFHNQIT